MTDFDVARLNMVESQVRTDDVTDSKLLNAMRKMPRERFVPKSKQALAYTDSSVEIAPGRFMMRPRAFGKLVQIAAIKPTDLVLDLGPATGYSTSILGQLADSVIALECDSTLASEAEALLGELSVDNAAFVTGKLEDGCPKQGPYDVIFINGALPEPSKVLEAQLKDGGKLVAIIQDGPIGKATLFKRVGDSITSRVVFDAKAVVLPGFAAEEIFSF